MKRYDIITFVLIILFGIAPFASAILGSVIANGAGCTFNEAESHSCIIHGHDYGGNALYALDAPLVDDFTLPVAEISLTLWGIVLIVHLLVRRRRRGRMGASDD
jgi:hypothetical protein